MSQDSGWKALGYTIGITEIPLMILIGYFVGRRIGRETEGVVLGGLLGVVLLGTYAVWAFKKNKETRASRGRPSRPPTIERQPP